jgi:hypothetical protein
MAFFNIHRFQIFEGGKLISRQNDYGKGFSVAAGFGAGWERHLGERWLVDIFLSLDNMWSWYNRYDGEGNIGSVNDHVVYRVLDTPFVHTQTGCGVCLGIEVYKQDLQTQIMERCSQVYSGGGFADAALLVDNCNNLSHFPPPSKFLFIIAGVCQRINCDVSRETSPQWFFATPQVRLRRIMFHVKHYSMVSAVE